MIEYIYSQEIRDYHKELGIEFSDEEKADLIWKAIFCKRSEVFDSLRELALETEDRDLKKQIAARLKYEEEKLAVFKENNSAGYIYVVYDEKRSVCGSFCEFSDAWACALKLKAFCEIEKQQIFSEDIGENFMFLQNSRENLGVDVFEPDDMDDYETGKYKAAPISRIEIDEEGTIQWVASAEYMTNERLHSCYEKTFQIVRFGIYNLQLGLPLPERFVVGGVKNVVTGEFGYMEDDICYQAGTSEVDGWFLRKDGFWRNETVSIQCLDRGPDFETDTEAFMAIQAYDEWEETVNWYLYKSGDVDSDTRYKRYERAKWNFINASREYARKNLDEPNVFNVQSVEELFIRE